MTILYFSRGFLNFLSCFCPLNPLVKYTRAQGMVSPSCFFFLSFFSSLLRWMEMQLNIIRKYSAVPFKKTSQSGLHPCSILGSTSENKLHFFLVYYRCSFSVFTTDVLKKSFSLSPLHSDLLKDRSWASFAWFSHSIC